MVNGEYIREDDIGLVVGHEKGKLEPANYGSDSIQLELRRDVVEAIEYGALGHGKVMMAWHILLLLMMIQE